MSQLVIARKYKAAQIESATPGQILIALYDGCVRFCRAAQVHIEDGNAAEKGKAISKSIAILGELRSTLDHGVAPELCDHLDRLYVFFQEQLSTANINMDPKPIEPVIRLMSELRDAWSEAVTVVERGGDEPLASGDR